MSPVGGTGRFNNLIFFFFALLGFELEGIQLEPLHQLYFVKDFFSR
jgi:hypothetical protein